MKKSCTIFNAKLANTLIQKGFQMQGIRQDNKYPDRVVFFFRNDEGIQQAIEDYKNEQRRSKYDESNSKQTTTGK